MTTPLWIPCNHFVKQSISFRFSKGGCKQADKYVVFWSCFFFWIILSSSRKKDKHLKKGRIFHLVVKHDRSDEQAQVNNVSAASGKSRAGGPENSPAISGCLRKISSMTRTPGAGQQRESPPAWRCQITVRQPGRPHSEKSGFESRRVESEA